MLVTGSFHRLLGRLSQQAQGVPPILDSYVNTYISYFEVQQKRTKDVPIERINTIERVDERWHSK
jgi:hypothetical protein